MKLPRQPFKQNAALQLESPYLTLHSLLSLYCIHIQLFFLLVLLTLYNKNSSHFTLYKLRTMYCNTPSAPTHQTDPSAITYLGRWLRRLKLDELPQLLNVIKGDMSLVGPRPCLPSQQVLIEHRQRRGVFSVRPGLTGKAQVLGVDMSNPERLAKIDAEYVAERSFVGDIVLIVQTLTGGRQAKIIHS